MKDEKFLNLSQDTETAENKKNQHVYNTLNSLRDTIFHRCEDKLHAIVEDWVQLDKKRLNAEALIQGLRYGPARKMAIKMRKTGFQEDIPYFMGEEHLITYKTVKEGKEGKGHFTGDLKPFGQVIQSLGYVQVSPNFVVKKMHIVQVNSMFVYLDTKERIKLTKFFKNHHKKTFEDINEKHPDCAINPSEYREADLCPIRKASKKSVQE